MQVTISIRTTEQKFAGGTVGGDWRIELSLSSDPATIAEEYQDRRHPRRSIWPMAMSTACAASASMPATTSWVRSQPISSLSVKTSCRWM